MFQIISFLNKGSFDISFHQRILKTAHHDFHKHI